MRREPQTVTDSREREPEGNPSWSSPRSRRRFGDLECGSPLPLSSDRAPQGSPMAKAAGSRSFAALLGVSVGERPSRKRQRAAAVRKWGYRLPDVGAKFGPSGSSAVPREVWVEWLSRTRLVCQLESVGDPVRRWPLRRMRVCCPVVSDLPDNASLDWIQWGLGDWGSKQKQSAIKIGLEELDRRGRIFGAKLFQGGHDHLRIPDALGDMRVGNLARHLAGDGPAADEQAEK